MITKFKTGKNRKNITILIISAAAFVTVLVFGVFHSAKAVKLDAPSDLILDSELLTWQMNENSTGYIVSSGSDEIKIDRTFFDLGKLTEPGGYSLKVKALGDQNKFRDSEWSDTVDVIRLQSPVLSVGKTELTWNNVERNYGYELYQGGVFLAHIEKDVTFYKLLNETPNEDFQITAKGNGIDVLDSMRSQAVNAVQLPAPVNLTVSGNVLRWDAVAGADSYLIGDEFPVTSTTAAEYDLKFVPPGQYRTSIQAVSDDSTVCTSEKSFIDITVDKRELGDLVPAITGNLLTWNRLENASGYQIIIKRGADVIKLIIVEKQSSPFLDLAGLDLYDAVYAVEITALGDGSFKDSPGKTLTYNRQTPVPKPALEPITGARIEGGMLRWDSLAEAAGYVVHIASNDAVLHNVSVAPNEPLEVDIPSLQLAPAQYNISLYARGGEAHDNSPPVTLSYTVTRLPAPLQFSYNGMSLSWDAVEYADYYVVDFENQPSITLSETSLAISVWPGEHRFTVKAVSNNREIQNSDNAVLNHTEAKWELGSIEGIRIETGIFRWNQMPHATGYIVRINAAGGTLHTFEKAPENQPEVDLYTLDIPLGSYEVILQALGDENYNNTAETATAYEEKMIRDARVRANFNYGNKYVDISEYWVMHYLNFSLKQGFTFDVINAPQEQWNTLYTHFLGGDEQQRQAAAMVIGNDIMVTYYYHNDDAPVVLMTTTGIPLVKNKLWGGWMYHYNGVQYVRLPGDIMEPLSIGAIVPKGDNLQVSSNIGRKNPAGGMTMNTTQLDDIRGKTLYVDVDVIINGAAYKETVAIEVPDF